MGLSIARMLAQKGANIIIVARDQKKLDAAVKEASVRGHFEIRQFHMIVSSNLN
jgi:short-subunit dehydrogenase